MQPSNELVEWDFTHALALQLRFSQYEDPIDLGTPRRPDARTRWLRVYMDYPDDYLPEFEELLGPAVYDVNADQQSLRKYFPQADFSVENVRNAVLDKLDDAQYTLLQVTDFYVTRLAETGEPIPEDIAAQRNEVRDTLARMKARARKSKPADLPSFRDEIENLPRPERVQRRKRFEIDGTTPGHAHVPGHIHGTGQPGDRPSALRRGEEPAPFDESLTLPPDPSIDGSPAPWAEPPSPPGDDRRD